MSFLDSIFLPYRFTTKHNIEHVMQRKKRKLFRSPYIGRFAFLKQAHWLRKTACSPMLVRQENSHQNRIRLHKIRGVNYIRLKKKTRNKIICMMTETKEMR